MAQIFLFVSCSQYDIPSTEVEVNKFDYSVFEEFSKSDIYENIKETIEKKKSKETTLEINKFILKVVNDEMNTNLSFPDLALKLNNFEANDIFSIALNNKWIDKEDVVLVNAVTFEIQSLGFETALKNYQEKVLKMPLSPEKFAEKNLFINSLKSIHYDNPGIFNNDIDNKSLEARSWLRCAAATVAFAAALVGLSGCATIAACALALVLFYAATNSFNMNCLE